MKRCRPETNLTEAVTEMWEGDCVVGMYVIRADLPDVKMEDVKVKLLDVARVPVSRTASGVTPLSEVTALLRTAHANLLLVGAEAVIVGVLDGLRSSCRQPVETCEARSFLPLSSPSHTGTLILRDVGNLTQEGQRRLMEWLDHNAHDRIQVIATNAVPLWPQVKNGAFTEALYYRLNVIYVDLTDKASLSSKAVMTNATASC